MESVFTVQKKVLNKKRQGEGGKGREGGVGGDGGKRRFSTRKKSSSCRRGPP